MMKSRRRITCSDILGRTGADASIMLILRNIMRCFAHTCIAAILLCAAASVAQKAPDHRLPSEADVAAAFDTLRAWVNDFETPQMDAPASRVKINGASGVNIVLRRSGRVLGMASDASGDDLMLRRAAGLALNHVLADPALANISARLRQQEVNDPNPPLTVDALRAEIGKSIIIELEIAGRVTPLIGQSIEQVSRKIIPGIDGIAVRERDRMEMIFPSELRATNATADPGVLLMSAAMKIGLAVKNVNELPRRESLGLYSFRSINLWQPSAETPPVQTMRGDLAVALDAVNRQSISQLADGIASHLVSSMWPQMKSAANGQVEHIPLGIMGSYSTIADHSRPLIASPLEQALCALALQRYSDATTMGIDEQTATRAGVASHQILQDLAVVAEGKEDPFADFAACAAIVYAVAEQPNQYKHAVIGPMFDRALARVQESFDPTSGFMDRSADDDRARSIAPHTQAMLAGAMMRAHRVQRQQNFHRIRQALDAAWRSVPQPQQIALLPWIGWAEAEFAVAASQPLAHVDELRLLVDLLNESQIESERFDEPQLWKDVEGGFALRAESQTSLHVLPTSQSVRPGAWFASAGNQTELVPEATAAEHQARLRELGRFLMQLSIRDTHRGWVRSPLRAIGGIRASTMDSDLPLPAQALGLLAAVETLGQFAEHAE